MAETYEAAARTRINPPAAKVELKASTDPSMRRAGRARTPGSTTYQM